ncbi:MAG TPA: hypothetical protein PKY35_07345 [Candidatus Hydrogenedentes bacterium]|nr:hypothetical protein [Candidatus Hydrogenedentota bacterium]HOL76828.1 hypothetical protein [Candidatus Hydrogenedentota bacterium]HPO86230.1 hypothetical protein [Candidatus Hydrogenedentota bacterium]
MLLPAPERRGELHFYVAKSLPYALRLGIAFFLITAGWGVQYFFLERGPWWIGLLGVALGVALLLVRGFDNTVPRRAPSEEWKPVRRSEVERIIELNVKQRKWDQAAIDITNARGFFSLVLLTILLAVIGYFLLKNIMPSIRDRHLHIVGANLAVMLLPFWLTGIRFTLKNDRLIVKAKMLLRLEDVFNSLLHQPGEVFQYQMVTAPVKKGQGEVPADIKAIVQFQEGPSEFLGIQMQIAINSVQGSDYPYFYCVLVARAAFGRITAKQLPPPQKNVVLEPSQDGDVVIMVIRQKTTKNSGYHTNQKVAQAIFNYSLRAARQLISSSPVADKK